jgi:hypothetical protein
VIFHSYVSLPEGITTEPCSPEPWEEWPQDSG